MSSAGLTESELKSQGKNYKVLTMPAASVPKSQVIGDPRGLYKCMIDPEPTKFWVLPSTLKRPMKQLTF